MILSKERETLTRDATAKLFGKLWDEVVVDPVLERTEDDDGPRVSHFDLLDRLVRENGFLFCNFIVHKVSLNWYRLLRREQLTKAGGITFRRCHGRRCCTQEIVITTKFLNWKKRRKTTYVLGRNLPPTDPPGSWRTETFGWRWNSSSSFPESIATHQTEFNVNDKQKRG